MPKEQLLQDFVEAYEEFIRTATGIVQHGVIHREGEWGPREVAAHIAGWEVMATVRTPHIVAGMAPFDETDEARQTVMDDAINATIVAMIGDQSFEAVCGLLRQAYQRNVEMLKKLDDALFQPGTYVYERTADAIKHCQEHMQELIHK